jgi:hypothetical protein
MVVKRRSDYLLAWQHGRLSADKRGDASMHLISPRKTTPLAAGVLGSLIGVRAPLRFIKPQLTKPKFLSAALTGGEPEFLFASEDHLVTISDLRPFADDLLLDREGFELLARPSRVTDFYDDDQVEHVYYPEIEALLARELGASRVVVFDATRRSDGGAGATNKDGLRRPASRIHVDYTVKSGPQRVIDLLGSAEARRLAEAGKRIAQVNVWRPITGPVERSPLAVADASTIKPENLVATEQVFPDRIGEIYHLTYDPAQRWYYAPRMTADEVLLLKGWDSCDDGRARFTPHTAFTLPDTPAAAGPRESIEVRTLVVWD